MQNKNKRFNAILFDMDGVIIDSKEQVEAFWDEKLKLHGIEIDREYLETRVHGRPARLIIDELFADLPEEERIKMDRECTEYDASQASFTIVPGVESLLHRLASLKVSFGLVTSALPPKVQRMLDSLSIDSPFRTIVTADLVENGKPDPECYLLGAERLGVPIDDILVFEDSVSGVQAATRAGATVVGVNEPHLAPILLDAGARDVISDFKQTTIREDQLYINVNTPVGVLT